MRETIAFFEHNLFALGFSVGYANSVLSAFISVVCVLNNFELFNKMTHKIDHGNICDVNTLLNRAATETVLLNPDIQFN